MFYLHCAGIQTDVRGTAQPHYLQQLAQVTWPADTDATRTAVAAATSWQEVREALRTMDRTALVALCKEQITLEPFERDHAVVIGLYRDPKKKK